VNIVVESQSGFYTAAVVKRNYFTRCFVRGSKLLRWLTMSALLPLLYLGKKCAPFLDKLDRDWALVTSGYFATAKKP
jgi:hypothetical protein